MEEQNDAAKVRFFPPGIPLLTVVLGYGLNLVVPLSQSYPLSAPARYFVGGLVALGAIVFLGYWSVSLFRKGGQSENPWKPTTHVEEQGPFKITRNPMYLQMLLVCVGISIALANWWILLLTPVAAWALQALAIKPEEAYLERKFGQAYLDYKQRVRRWI